MLVKQNKGYLKVIYPWITFYYGCVMSLMTRPLYPAYMAILAFSESPA